MASESCGPRYRLVDGVWLAQARHQAATLEPHAGFRATQVLLYEDAQIGFVVYIHFQASIPANENMRACALRLCAMFGEAADSEMRRKQTGGRAENSVRASAVARRDNHQAWSSAFYGEQFINVA
jgi:hypothetical protein